MLKHPLTAVDTLPSAAEKHMLGDDSRWEKCRFKGNREMCVVCSLELSIGGPEKDWRERGGNANGGVDEKHARWPEVVPDSELGVGVVIG